VAALGVDVAGDGVVRRVVEAFLPWSAALAAAPEMAPPATAAAAGAEAPDAGRMVVAGSLALPGPPVRADGEASGSAPSGCHAQEAADSCSFGSWPDWWLVGRCSGSFGVAAFSAAGSDAEAASPDRAGVWTEDAGPAGAAEGCEPASKGGGVGRLPEGRAEDSWSDGRESAESP